MPSFGIEATDPDVVLIDIDLPHGGGRDAIAAMKRIRSKTRIVVLTFQEELGYIQAAVRRRADEYVGEESARYRAPDGDSAVAQGETMDSARTRASAVERAKGREARCSHARRARPSRATASVGDARGSATRGASAGGQPGGRG